MKNKTEMEQEWSTTTTKGSSTFLPPSFCSFTFFFLSAHNSSFYLSKKPVFFVPFCGIGQKRFFGSFFFLIVFLDFLCFFWFFGGLIPGFVFVCLWQAVKVSCEELTSMMKAADTHWHALMAPSGKAGKGLSLLFEQCMYVGYWQLDARRQQRAERQ